jgi:glycosyltransferase involved in cell wall biosynthesis
LKILFVHNALSTFVRIDLNLLQEEYEVEELFLRNKMDVSPLAIWQAVRRNDQVFGWFASWHTLLPVMFARFLGKPSVLIAGGYDTANVPEAGYGNQRKWLPRVLTNMILRSSSTIICNSRFTRQETILAAKIPVEKIDVVYHGLPIPKKTEVKMAKENMLLNIGNVSHENLLRKGIKPFLETAKFLPNHHFVQAGKWRDDSINILKSNLSPNAEVLGFVGDEELQSLYARSKYYVQPSLHEGFGMSVVEAMQHGCIPVVSENGALPEVVGKYGIKLHTCSAEAIARAIKSADLRAINTAEIMLFANNTYSLKKRKEGLIHAINKQFVDGNQWFVKN